MVSHLHLHTDPAAAHLGDGVGDLLELDAESQLGGHGRKGVAGGLGRQRRRARQAGVHL